MAPKPTTGASWGEEQTLTVLRHIIASALEKRSELYAREQLVDFSGNGGSRINQKLQQTLQAMLKGHPGAQDMVKEEVARLSGRKNNGDAAGPKRKRVKTEQAKEEDE